MSGTTTDIVFMMLLIGIIALTFYVITSKVNNKYRRQTLHMINGVACGVAVIMTFALIGSYSSILAEDHEVWGGVFTGKTRTEVHCRHSYSCPPCYTTTDSKGNRTEHCATCYDHPFDVDWEAQTNVGRNFDFDTVDRQGLIMPNDWNAIYVGEPAFAEHTYRNWIKASQFSIMAKKASTLAAGHTPPYPMAIYGRWLIDRVVSDGVPVPELQKWNIRLMALNSVIGPAKQGSVIIVLTKNGDRAYADAVYNAWNGAAKNDIVVFVGTPNYPAIAWADVRAFSQSQMFQVSLRDDIQALGTLDRDVLYKTILDDTNKFYQREHMRKYEYLEKEITPPIWMPILILVLLIGGLIYAYRTNI